MNHAPHAPQGGLWLNKVLHATLSIPWVISSPTLLTRLFTPLMSTRTPYNTLIISLIQSSLKEPPSNYYGPYIMHTLSPRPLNRVDASLGHETLAVHSKPEILTSRSWLRVLDVRASGSLNPKPKIFTSKTRNLCLSQPSTGSSSSCQGSQQCNSHILRGGEISNSNVLAIWQQSSREIIPDRFVCNVV